MIETIIFGMATWRVAALLVREGGPFSAFKKLRELAGIQHDENGEPWIIPNNLLAGILSCVWCASVWVAGGWFFFWIFAPEISLKLATAFSFSTAAILIDKFIQK